MSFYLNCIIISFVLGFLNFMAVFPPGFTRLVVSLWAVTMLSLYIRVQVNILGRHLYIDTARGLGSAHLLVRATMFYVTASKIYFHTQLLFIRVVGVSLANYVNVHLHLFSCYNI